VDIWVWLPQGSVFLELENKDRIIAPDWDLALLRISKQSLLFGILKPLPLVQSGEIEGKDVVIKGYPNGDGAQLVSLPGSNFAIKIQTPVDKIVPVPFITYKSKCCSGSSGSPLIDKQTGEVVGIHAESRGGSEKGALHIVLLHHILEGISNGMTTIFPANLPFKIPATLLSQAEVYKPRLTQNVPEYGLKIDDVIKEIDGFEVNDDSTISLFKCKVKISDYAYMKVSGSVVIVKVIRQEQELSIKMKLPGLYDATPYTAYHMFRPPGGRTILLGDWLLTEENPPPEMKKQNNRQNFILFKPKSIERRIKLTCSIINFLQNTATRRQRTALIDFREQVTNFSLIKIIAKNPNIAENEEKENIYEKEIHGFPDVLSAIKECKEFPENLVKLVAQLGDGHTQELPVPRFTDDQMRKLAERHRLPQSMKPYCGLLVSAHILQEQGVPVGGNSPINDVTRVYGI